jgi:hypothetical protein
MPAKGRAANNGGMSVAYSHEDYGSPVGAISGPDLWALVISRGMCSRSGVDPDQWYPVSAPASMARLEAARAIAVCSACVVRQHCLELSLRYWTVGQHGVWGGTVPAERAELRTRRNYRDQSC